MMKIKKTRPAETQVTATTQPAAEKKNYVSATSHIETAIKILGSSADIANDNVAKDAIANLSVILFDLKS